LGHPNNVVDFGLAPSFPLILEDVMYNFNFENDKEAVNKKEELEKLLLDEIKYLFLKNANKLRPKSQQSK
jgi:hypothetical protein